ncbi:MAG: hypothetical protein J6D53_01120, partial [Blautia sp.]|nr:hypothetical protein [Blautia sp.]
MNRRYLFLLNRIFKKLHSGSKRSIAMVLVFVLLFSSITVTGDDNYEEDTYGYGAEEYYDYYDPPEERDVSEQEHQETPEDQKETYGAEEPESEATNELPVNPAAEVSGIFEDVRFLLTFPEGTNAEDGAWLLIEKIHPDSEEYRSYTATVKEGIDLRRESWAVADGDFYRASIIQPDGSIVQPDRNVRLEMIFPADSWAAAEPDNVRTVYFRDDIFEEKQEELDVAEKTAAPPMNKQVKDDGLHITFDLNAVYVFGVMKTQVPDGTPIEYFVPEETYVPEDGGEFVPGADEPVEVYDDEPADEPQAEIPTQGETLPEEGIIPEENEVSHEMSEVNEQWDYSASEEVIGYPAEEVLAEEDSAIPEEESFAEEEPVIPAEETGEAEYAEESLPVPEEESVPEEELTSVHEASEEEEVPYYEAVSGSRIVRVEGEDYELRLDYTAEAGIPAEAVFEAKAITEENGDAWLKYGGVASRAVILSQDMSADEADNLVIKGIFDLTIFDPEGRVIEPKGPVHVSVGFAEAEEPQDVINAYAVHFPETGTSTEEDSIYEEVQEAPDAFDGEIVEESFSVEPQAVGTASNNSGLVPEVIPAEYENGSVEFYAGEFSVYVIVCTTLTQTLTASDGNEYSVTVTYDSASGITSDTELFVSEIKEGDAGYDGYVEKTAAALGQKPENLAFARPFEITLKNPQTGGEYQPNEAVQVSIQLLKDDLNHYTNVDVVHIPDGAGENAQVMDTTVHGEAVEFAADGFSVYVLTASNSNGSETANPSACALTIGESTPLGEILSALDIEADKVRNALTDGNGLTVNQTAGDQPTDWTVVLNSAEGDVLRLTMSDDSTVGIAVKPLVTVTANDASKTYGDSDPGTFTAAVTGLAGEDTVAYAVSREPGENAGAYTITPSGGAEQGKYVVKYVTGTFTINKKALTITANSETKKYTGSSLSLDSDDYTSTELAEGDTIASVTFAGEQTYLGTCEIVPSAAVIKNQAADEDVTESYDITYVNGSLTVTWPENLVEKELTAFNVNLATYKITVNPKEYVLTADGRTYILKDTFSENQSINYGSVTAASDIGEPVTYDFSGQTGTYTIPDATRVTITYTTRVAGQVGDAESFSNTAVVGSMEGTEFKAGPSVTLKQTQTISPTGTDISGTGGVYSIDLFAYADGHMERGLGGAEFRLLDSNMRPMYYLAGENKGKEITFTTGEDGTVAIELNNGTDGLSIQKNTVYFLEMVTAPYEIADGEYVYYRKDDTFYSFLITDEPSYEFGDIFSYFNGDVLKVRCNPETEGINITKRFSGNYNLTDEQKNAIRFVLQKEAQYTASGWVDVESHTYADFAYGSINFDTGRKGGTELENFATYRIIEEHALPEALADTIDENVSVTVSYQQDGKRVTENSNEFTVDPDEKLAFSYDFAFTNEYVDHKLTLIKIN